MACGGVPAAAAPAHRREYSCARRCSERSKHVRVSLVALSAEQSGVLVYYKQ